MLKNIDVNKAIQAAILVVVLGVAALSLTFILPILGILVIVAIIVGTALFLSGRLKF